MLSCVRVIGFHACAFLVSKETYWTTRSKPNHRDACMRYCAAAAAANLYLRIEFVNFEAEFVEFGSVCILFWWQMLKKKVPTPVCLCFHVCFFVCVCMDMEYK